MMARARAELSSSSSATAMQLFKSTQVYDSDFRSTSLAYLNRYPNPYAKHVLSSDTLESYVDEQGRLRTTRLVVKTGLLPEFLMPFLGKSLQLWIIEKSIVDPHNRCVQAYSANIDHHRFIKVQEYLRYDCRHHETVLTLKVLFSSNFVGLKQRIEQWSKDRFSRNMSNLRQGFVYATDRWRASRQLALT